MAKKFDVNVKLAEYKDKSAHIEKFELMMNQKIDKIKAEYLPIINPLKEAKEKLKLEIENWAVENKDQLNGKKSWDFVHGTIGFRESKQTAFIEGYTVESVIEILKRMGKKFSKYLRVKTEFDKAAYKKDVLANVISNAQAEEIGAIVQTVDTIYIEPNLIAVD